MQKKNFRQKKPFVKVRADYSKEKGTKSFRELTSVIDCIFNNNFEYIYISDPVTNDVIYVNKSAEKLYGEEVVGRKCYEAIYGQEGHCSLCASGFMQEEKHNRGEYTNPYLKKSFMVISSLIPLSDTGEVCFQRAVDITESKKNELETKRRLLFSETVKSISSHFVGIMPFDDAVNECLQDIGTLCKAGRAYLFTLSSDGIQMNNTHEWCAAGVSPQIEDLQGLPAEMFPWWMAKLRRGEVILINDIEQMPDEASAEKEILAMQDIKSVLVLPIATGEQLVGFIGVDNVEDTGAWTEDDLTYLRVASEIIGNAISRDQAQKDLNFLATHDFLTKVPNRYYFEKELQDIVNKATVNNPSALLFLDIDNFKTINDNYGHAEGDKVLITLVNKLKRGLRKGDILARLGGDEFAIILRDVKTEEAKIIADRFRVEIGCLEHNAGMGNTPFNVNVSIGLVAIEGSVNPQKLLSWADIALRWAKEEGKNQVLVMQYREEKFPWI